LFQAQNQQLLTVSDEQSQILNTVEQYKPVFPGYGKGLGGPKYWFWRFKLWWQTSSSSSANYEGLVLGGITAQVSHVARQWAKVTPNLS